MGLKFGTDGVRGLAHSELTIDWVTQLAFATVRATDVANFVIGIDGRESGKTFASALAAGFKLAGAKAEYLGIIPTPGIAHIASSFGIGGAVISASHNQAEYNGVKFFLPDGQKLSDEVQHRIEALLGEEISLVQVNESFEISHDADKYFDSWTDSIRNSTAFRDFENMSVVIDCANGAASYIAPQLFKEITAKLTVINAEPNGRNINLNCGSTDMSSLSRVVREINADVGLAFDGDADRVLAIDDKGKIIDGDYLLAIFANDLSKRSMLNSNTVVATVMANMGFHEAMKSIGVTTHITPVGDRHILQALSENKWSLGGEQSGHIIFANDAKTGDGILTGIHLLDCINKSDMTLHGLSESVMQKYPQVLRSVILRQQIGNQDSVFDQLQPFISRAESLLSNEGRILVRPSGTEPILRIMVEGKTQSTVQTVADSLFESIEEVLK